MIDWKKQGDALVGVLTLPDGRAARVAVLGSRANPKGAMIVIPSGSNAKAQVLPLPEAVNILGPQQVIEVICMQERAYGESGLEPPDFAP